MESVFHLSSKRIRISKIFLIGSSFFLILLTTLIFIGIQHNALRSFELYCEFPFGFLVLSLSIANEFYSIRQEKLILTPEKIFYQTFGLSIDVPWSKVRGIKNDPAWVRRNIENLYIHGNHSKTNFLWFYSLHSKNLIPLTTFSENWRDSELGQQIKQYAPHLFEKEKSAQSADKTLGEPN